MPDVPDGPVAEGVDAQGSHHEDPPAAEVEGGAADGGERRDAVRDEAALVAGPAEWMEGLPERELHDTYAATVRARFPSFGVRAFDDARYDMAQPLHLHVAGRPIEQLVVDAIVTPASHERFAEDLSAFVTKHGLRGWLDYGESLVFVTDHGQFTDVPVLTETIGRLGLGRREATAQVVSEMISVLELDLGAGPVAVMDLLRRISAVVQTVPRLEGSPSEELRTYRRRKNSAGIRILEAVRDTPGSTTVASLVARHNVESRNGKTLYVHEPNRRTLETYESERVKVVPVFVDCPTFDPEAGWTPADMRYELFAPVVVEDARRDTRAVLELLRAATERAVGDRYEHGVKIRSWAAQRASTRVQAALPSSPRRRGGGPTDR